MNAIKRSRVSGFLGAILGLTMGTLAISGPAVLGDETTAAVIRHSPEWKLKDLDGREVSSAQFKGKVVVLDFWATWCGPCVGEIPSYVELQKKYGSEGLVIIGALSHDPKTGAKIREFAVKNGMNYTILVSDDAIEEAFGGFDAIPTTFLIGRDGQILHRKTGALPHEEYEKLVVSALHNR